MATVWGGGAEPPTVALKASAAGVAASAGPATVRGTETLCVSPPAITARVQL